MKETMTENKELYPTAGLRIPYEVADGITLTVMVEHLAILREECRAHTEDATYMHPEDYHSNMTKLIPALELLIEYFGGTV